MHQLTLLRHGQSQWNLLVKHFDNMPEHEVEQLNIPTGIPLVYELDADLHASCRRYLGDPEAARRAARSVAVQADAGI